MNGAVRAQGPFSLSHGPSLAEAQPIANLPSSVNDTPHRMKREPDQVDAAFVPNVAVDTASKELVRNLFSIVRIARDRKKTLVQALCVASVLGAVYYAVAPRYYRSSAKLLITSEQ